MYICMYMCVYVYVCGICIYVYVYVYVCMCMYMYIYMFNSIGEPLQFSNVSRMGVLHTVGGVVFHSFSRIIIHPAGHNWQIRNEF